MYKNLAAALAAACFLSPSFSQPAAAADPLKIGFVYVAPVTDAGQILLAYAHRLLEINDEAAAGCAAAALPLLSASQAKASNAALSRST